MIRIKIALFVLLAAFAFLSASVYAQTPEALKPSVLTGEVLSITPASIVLQTKDGPAEISLTAKSEFKRVPPENPSLKAAVAASISDIGVGDKLVVSGVYGADKKILPARSVYLMTKSDISQKQAKENEQWRTRGIAGKVISVNPQTNQIVVETRGFVGSSNVTVTPKENIKYLRYAPDSVKYSEAKASTIADLKAGDMVRALGDKSADGTTFAAEEVVSGAFQTRAGTVKSVDATKGEVVVTDLQTKKDLTIAVTPASVLKKFPEEMAQRMAQAQMGQAPGPRPAGQGATPPQGGAPGAPGGQGRGGFGGGQRGGGIDDMLDRFPDITASDLKAGDVIAVSSTKNGDLDRITAIKLLSGVEPFLRAAQASAAAQPGGNRRALDLNIPGLDGFGGP